MGHDTGVPAGFHRYFYGHGNRHVTREINEGDIQGQDKSALRGGWHFRLPDVGPGGTEGRAESQSAQLPPVARHRGERRRPDRVGNGGVGHAGGEEGGGEEAGG